LAVAANGKCDPTKDALISNFGAGLPNVKGVVNPGVPLDPGAQGLAQIQHVVVIYQENQSFDALYGSFPGANGLSNAMSSNPASLTQVDRSTGKPIPLAGFFNPVDPGDPALLNSPPPALTPNPPSGFSNNGIDSRFLAPPVLVSGETDPSVTSTSTTATYQLAHSAITNDGT